MIDRLTRNFPAAALTMLGMITAIAGSLDMAVVALLVAVVCALIDINEHLHEAVHGEDDKGSDRDRRQP